jgi:hypothetical protein
VRNIREAVQQRRDRQLKMKHPPTFWTREQIAAAKAKARAQDMQAKLGKAARVAELEANIRDHGHLVRAAAKLSFVVAFILINSDTVVADNLRDHIHIFFNENNICGHLYRHNTETARCRGSIEEKDCEGEARLKAIRDPFCKSAFEAYYNRQFLACVAGQSAGAQAAMVNAQNRASISTEQMRDLTLAKNHCTPIFYPWKQ